MTDFTEQDLSDSRFEKVLLRRATFEDVSLADATLTDVDLSGVRIHAARLDKVRMTGVEVPDLVISGEVRRLVVNGVDVGPLVEAELDRRHPERAAMRPTSADGFREAFAILDRLWAETLDHARALRVEQLHEQVDGEWSFIQTLRHLGFVHACWISGVVHGFPTPWHPLDLPSDEVPAHEGVPWERRARPELHEVLSLRRQRRATVAELLERMDDSGLARQVTSATPFLTDVPDLTVGHCLRVVLNEEWEHRRYAERDLAVLAGSTTRS
ncbi:hypothetical protein GCM10011376_16660 [Nocardioides flavus (ex Wang et al. 2016)]|uniref:DinB-like domain-containing protein n=1 Tax=Nocardioides flavus (ex Wang et al. 2016) TaxID=2058780 RepID=A0ABQ3HK24_9ACTN|nr:DinB family protein [Nocardioides flavus (ex Wang et al. 2016)]GHE17056.1 hypothetical protein GCM10011376_16660 [Nocardioides flavus (ex Wang et al. 2016)]